MKYREIKEKKFKGVDVEAGETFFAFGHQQFDEAIEKLGLKDKKIYSAGFGLYGTKEGLNNYHKKTDDAISRIDQEIRDNCSPQEVYDHEFDNYECEIVCDDQEAIEVVASIFGVERAKTDVKRRYGYCDI